MSIDARFAERHSTGKGWMALSILTRIVMALHVTGGMACTYARSIRAPMPFQTSIWRSNSATLGVGMTTRSKSLPSFHQTSPCPTDSLLDPLSVIAVRLSQQEVAQRSDTAHHDPSAAIYQSRRRECLARSRAIRVDQEHQAPRCCERC
jgi:hypothetical protein